MRPVNLFVISRSFNNGLFGAFERVLSNRNVLLSIKEHERYCISSLTSTLLENGASISELDNFYYSFEIPQIGKEFDLLRISESNVINIEMKSEFTEEFKIVEQLQKNIYYLRCLKRRVFPFSYIASTKSLYWLSDQGILTQINPANIITLIRENPSCFTEDISQLFKVSEFLVSPISDPGRFIGSEYFLTDHQQRIKQSAISHISGGNTANYFGITGSPGTGKTLLLYDLARYCASLGRCCIIHCGTLSTGHHCLNSNIKNLSIIPAKETSSLVSVLPPQCKYIFVDESQRYWKWQFDALVSYVETNGLCCVFSFDSKQVLSQAELRANIFQCISQLRGIKIEKLTNKIRTNKELASFIRKLLNLTSKDDLCEYPSVSIAYAKDNDEAGHIGNIFTGKGYTFINYTGSLYNRSKHDVFSALHTTHAVVGQEFDRVIMFIDDSFSYNDKGELLACEHPNPDYLYRQLLFQGITRVREKLAIVVINNEPVLEKILSILHK